MEGMYLVGMVGDRTAKGKDAIRQWMGAMDFESPKFTVDSVIARGTSSRHTAT